MGADMRIRLVVAAIAFPLLGLVIGGGMPVFLTVGGICLLAALIGYATQRD
jgi:hypothetical protein